MKADHLFLKSSYVKKYIKIPERTKDKIKRILIMSGIVIPKAKSGRAVIHGR